MASYCIITVLLHSVRSFGTENRPSAKHIPPRSEVYEFIIFRGSDIKDLNVSEMPEETSSPPQDPAILSAVSYFIVWCASFRIVMLF